MTEKFLYCEKCQDLVPESEVKDLFKTGKPFHTYTETRNFYQNQMPGVIGYCPVEERIYCGSVREPTEQEYFIHFTCNSERNKPDANKRTESKASSARLRPTRNSRKVGARKR